LGALEVGNRHFITNQKLTHDRVLLPWRRWHKLRHEVYDGGGLNNHPTIELKDPHGNEDVENTDPYRQTCLPKA